MNRDGKIVEIIEEHPIVGEFLLYNDVDCVNCTIKTCLLKDILDIHNFSKEDQVEMYIYMEKLINNEVKEMKKFIPEKYTNDYHEIINMLIDEHTYVKELLYTAEFIVSKPNFLDKYKSDLDQVIAYLKSYADDYHHGKEEQYLFNLYPENEAVKVMLEEHEQGRAYRKILLNSNNEQEIKETVIAYAEMLKEHIHKEDDILFPYLDRILKEKDIKEINEKLKSNDPEIKEEVKRFISDFNNKQFTR
ncbi:hemerythrin domain-containing protein [Mycoplasma sp. P36-A1]|uniref:hemerythrin domain-containing protein n=1 Tax=Mycoplasma sp. P36-A1 TaxID=3252900 RepID=UPI003C2C8517